MVYFKKDINPGSNVFSGCDEGGRVVWSWGVQFSAVATVSAVGSLSHLIEEFTVYPLGCPLPWVLNTVGEEGVCSLDVKATLVDSCLQSLGVAGHVETFEDTAAHVIPVGELEHLGAHWVELRWGLEPTVFRAVLVGPGTAS